jgi:DNA-binding response OmpR family regulator
MPAPAHLNANGASKGCAQRDELSMVVLCLNESFSTTLAHWLRSLGIRVEIAQSGGQARQLLHRDSRCVLVTDRLLPPWPGLPRLASLKRSHQFLRIVAIARDDPDSRYVALAAGADAVATAPLRRQAVLQAMDVVQGSGRG